MEDLKSLINILAFAAIGFSIVEIYLTLNKLWSRKHEKVVAESISISARFIGLIPTSIFAFYYLLEQQWQGAIETSLWIMFAIVQILIGAGLWVHTNENVSKWILLKRALKLERSEVGDLAKSFFTPANSEKIIDILKQIALIDQHLDKKEKEFIESFSTSWGLQINWDEFIQSQQESEQTNIVKLRNDLLDYLRTSPPYEQVSQLTEIITLLINIDNHVSSEEELISEELIGHLKNHLQSDENFAYYSVAIVPQNLEQEKAISDQFLHLEKNNIAGGVAFLHGPYYSENFAEIVRQEYQSLGFFSVIVQPMKLT